MACKYGESLGCAECDYVHFVMCSRFKEARVRECANKLGVFKYGGVASGVPAVEVCYAHYSQSGIKDVRSLYSKKEYSVLSSRLKSMSLWVALHEYSGLPVVYMSMDSIVEACFAYGRGEYEFVRGVYFLEVWECGIEQMKAVSFLNSVISKIVGSGGRVFLLSSWVLPVLGLNWQRVVTCDSKKRVGVKRNLSVSVSSPKGAGSYMQEEGVL